MNNQESVKQGNAVYFAIILNYIFINIGLEVLVQNFHITFTIIETLLIAQVGYAFPAIVYVIYKKEKLRDCIRLRKINILSILLLIVFTFAIIPLINLVSALSLLIGENQISSTITGMMGQSSFVASWLAVGILPAIMEEFVYRGVIYNKLRRGNARKAILCSALFFGLLHMNINQFAYAFVMGIILALAVEATGTILGAMVIHATMNSYSIVLTAIQPYLIEKLNDMQQSVGQEAEVVSTTMSRADIINALPTYFVLAIGGTAFAAFIFFLIAKYNNRLDTVKQIVAGEEKAAALYTEPVGIVKRQNVRFADVFFILAVIISATIMLLAEFY